uniref:Uncharacterized protein n=1 Tax=Lotharella globosa TaxID=91324 RepID=A0A7S4DEC3_9EUKA
MAMGFYENSRPFSMGVQNRSNIVERRRRRMGARKHRRYLNSILATHDRLAELSQSEVEFEEEQFPDFNEYKSYFVPGKELRDAEEVLKVTLVQDFACALAFVLTSAVNRTMTMSGKHRRNLPGHE